MLNIRLEDMCSVNAAEKMISINQSMNILIKFEGKIQNNSTSTVHKSHCKQVIQEYKFVIQMQCFSSNLSKAFSNTFH